MILNPEFRSVCRPPRPQWRKLVPGVAVLSVLVVLGGLRMQHWQAMAGGGALPAATAAVARHLAPPPVKAPVAPAAEPSAVPSAPPIESIETRQATVEAMLSMHPLQFAPGTARLSAEDRAWVAELAERLAGGDERIHVRGHSDGLGASGRQQRVSLERARAVAEALVAGGVTPARLDVEGWGARQPVDSNASAAGRARNRRVDLVLSTGAEP